MNKLLITIDDIARLSGFDGNIDNDTINPFIFMAQNAEIKRILGDSLYLKITTDFANNSLSGDYLNIYNSYVTIILAYYTCSYYLKLGVPKVSQNGVYLVTPEKTEQIGDERKEMATSYEALAKGLEINLLEYLKTLNLPEYQTSEKTKSRTYLNWMKPTWDKRL